MDITLCADNFLPQLFSLRIKSNSNPYMSKKLTIPNEASVLNRSKVKKFWRNFDFEKRFIKSASLNGPKGLMLIREP